MRFVVSFRVSLSECPLHDERTSLSPSILASRFVGRQFDRRLEPRASMTVVPITPTAQAHLKMMRNGRDDNQPRMVATKRSYATKRWRQ